MRQSLSLIEVQSIIWGCHPTRFKELLLTILARRKRLISFFWYMMYKYAQKTLYDSWTQMQANMPVWDLFPLPKI